MEGGGRGGRGGGGGGTVKDAYINIDAKIVDDFTIGTLPDDLWRLNIEVRFLANTDGTLPEEIEMAFLLNRDPLTILDKLKALTAKGLLKWSDDIERFALDRKISEGPFYEPFYPEDWPDIRREILKRDLKMCLYCGDIATQVDHILPVTRGGGHTPNNLASACGYCNKSKGNRDFVSWYEKQPFFSESRANHIRSIMPY